MKTLEKISRIEIIRLNALIYYYIYIYICSFSRVGLKTPVKIRRNAILSTKKTSKKARKTVTTNVELKLNMDQVNQLPINEGISYKQLCEKLNIKYYSGGDSKDIQLSELSRYMRYEIKPNKKIVISEIYTEPKKKEYSYPVNTLYAECIKKILQRYLSTRVNDKGITYVYSQRLYLILSDLILF